MLTGRIHILISALLILLVITFYDINIVFGSESLMGDYKLAKNTTIRSTQTPLKFEQVQFAKAVRNLIDSLSTQENSKDLISALRSKVTNEIIHSDSSLGHQILYKLDHDSTFIRNCLYLADLTINWHSVRSDHFIFYFQDENAPDTSAMEAWDKYFKRLTDTFGTQISERVPFKIDPSEKYGRCFPPWEVRWGIRQSGVGDNSHELAHIMLFKYSDVPFFHEPLAFIYGTYQGDFHIVSERILEYEKTITDSGYVSATELLHFPSIIGLHKSRWASSFYFIYKLITKYDLKRLLELMRMTPWGSPVEAFLNNFKAVYGIELKEFEHNILQEMNQ